MIIKFLGIGKGDGSSPAPYMPINSIKFHMVKNPTTMLLLRVAIGYPMFLLCSFLAVNASYEVLIYTLGHLKYALTTAPIISKDFFLHAFLDNYPGIVNGMINDISLAKKVTESPEFKDTLLESIQDNKVQAKLNPVNFTKTYNQCLIRSVWVVILTGTISLGLGLVLFTKIANG